VVRRGPKAIGGADTEQQALKGESVRKRRRTALLSAVTALASALALLVLGGQDPAAAHGAQPSHRGHGHPARPGPKPEMRPGSRMYLCWQDSLIRDSDPMAHNPECAGAVAQSGHRALSGGFSVRAGAAGRTRGYIPDGRLCSAGNPAYGGFDMPGTDWPVTHLTSGAEFRFAYDTGTASAGRFTQYITKDSWDPTTPLTWSDLERRPFSSGSHTIAAGFGKGGHGTRDWTARLPSGKTGQHIVYTVWQRAHSKETLYSCSDVVFDGGHGEVTGVGQAPSDPGEPIMCMGLYSVTSSFDGGFEGQMEVMNHGTEPFTGWTVSWLPGVGETIRSVTNATMTTAADGTVTVKNIDSNATVPPDGEVIFQFTAGQTGGAQYPIGTINCTSP
jgi:predicted carbohydrate-binding protein with CBM5 and CBM33 domain